jgi:hypothetical protein
MFKPEKLVMGKPKNAGHERSLAFKVQLSSAWELSRKLGKNSLRIFPITVFQDFSLSFKFILLVNTL